MHKSVKGAVAAAAAGLLLLGGAGSLAYWTANGTVTGGSINAGKLALVNPVAGQWLLNGSAVTGTVAIVPGDHLDYTGSYEVDAVGENLQATLGVTGGSSTGSLATYVTTAVSATVDGRTVTTVTDDNDGHILKVKVSVDFPFGTTADNNSQGATLNLADVAVTLTQTDATP